jgi:hypothetical protein
MSWSDDIRCLYCDGRLPLYRKITHGQFCSSAHRKAYWREQERLAVERLHQTHNSLKAFTLPDANPFPAPGPPPSEPESVALVPWSASLAEAAAAEPVSAGLFSAAVRLCAEDSTAPMIALDPLEYEVEVVPAHPVIEHAGPQAGEISGRWAVAGRAEAGRVSAQAPSVPDLTAFSTPCWCEPVQVVRPREPELLTPEPDYGSLVSFASLEGVDWRGSGPAPAGIEPVPMQPSAIIGVELALPLASEVLERMFDKLPRPDKLFSLWVNGRALAAFVPRGVVGFADPAIELAGLQKLASGVANVFRELAAARLIGLPRLEIRPIAVVLQVALRPTPFERPQTKAPLLTPTGSRSAKEPTFAPPGALGISLHPANHDRRITASASAVKFPGSVTMPPLSSDGLRTAPPAAPVAIPLPAAVRASAKAISVALLPQPLATKVMLPVPGLEPVNPRPVDPASPPPDQFEAGTGPRGTAARLTPPARMQLWPHVSGFWKHAPRDLKLLLFGIPMMLALVFHPGLPKVRVSAGKPAAGFAHAIQTQLASFRQSMAERAAIALDEDFRSGLDDWNSRSGEPAEWSYDAAGFVKPGALALYAPSEPLSDYQMQFLGMINQKALSWVVRASDFDNFYVIKLVERKSGPLPEIVLTRYAVIQGKARDRVDTPVRINARSDMLYLVRMDIRGDDFALWLQNQMIDNWSEPRLPHGGVGFFTAHDEESSLRWLQVTHQYDMLGRLCAYLAPYNISSN